MIFLGLIAAMATGMPVALAFMVVNVIGLMWVSGGPVGLLSMTGSIYLSMSRFSLMAVPMFFLLGAVLFHSGVIHQVMEVTNAWIGHIRARLLYVALGAGTGLASLSGAGTADTALLGSTLYPEMERQGYDKKLCLGVIASAGLVAAVIPPSGLAVLLGSLAEISIGKLLLAGVGPGLTMMVIYTIYVTVRVMRNPSLAPIYPSATIPLHQKILMTAKLAPMVLIIFMVMGFIFLGITTPSEAAATGAIGAVLVTIMYRRFSFRMVWNSVTQVIRISGMFLFIIAGATAYGQLLATTGATREFLDVLVNLPIPPLAIFFGIQLAVVVLGLFMSQVAIMLITIPIINPVIAQFGWDPVWFYVVYLMNMTIGAESPPFGLALFVLKGVVPQASMMDIYKAQVPFIIMDIGAMAVIMLVPSIALFLPNLAK